MRFEKCDFSKLKINRSRAVNLKLLDDFKKSRLECAEVLDISSKKPEYVATSLNNTIRRFKEEFVNIQAHSVQRRIYLVNYNLIEDRK